MKVCRVCHQKKSKSGFYKLAHTHDGLNYRCIECQNAYNREYSRNRALAKCDPVVITALKNAPHKYLTRFAVRVKRLKNGCWEWLGGKHPKSGYGRFWLTGRMDRLAHRLSYEWCGNPIMNDLVIDHICRNRACVNPEHMEQVSLVENVMRGISVWAINARKTHCARGHEFTPENTYTHQNMRHCRECARIRKRAYRQEKAASARL